MDKIEPGGEVISQAKPVSTLDRKRHIRALIAGLTGELSRNYEKLVPAQTWTVYWITHSLALLEQTQFLDTIVDEVIDFVKESAHKDGGYGGGPGQIAHLATTFAAVNALITTSREEALESIDRGNLVRFLHRMKQLNGSFSVHDDGEIDSRATYCVLSILKCLNIQDNILLENVADWILKCQTYEGGFGSVPGSEAHGGYTFCCVASLCLMDQLNRANIPALLRWLTSKQSTDEGGFNGRSNKLVDSCYSYWQGAVFPLLHPYLRETELHDQNKKCSPNSDSSDHRDGENHQVAGTTTTATTTRRTRSSSARSPTKTTDPNANLKTQLDKSLDSWLFDVAALQDYILNQCQAETGLLIDKPGAAPDFYHTCYALSGLSISQHQPDGRRFDIGALPINLLGLTHPLFNLSIDCLNYCFSYFGNKKIETFQERKEGSERTR